MIESTSAFVRTNYMAPLKAAVVAHCVGTIQGSRPTFASTDQGGDGANGLIELNDSIHSFHVRFLLLSLGFLLTR